MTDIPLFIRLKTSQPLDKQDAVAWYHYVRDTLPDGILDSVQTTNPDGDPDIAFMVRKEANDGTNYYVVPLTRDLTNDEFDFVRDNYVGPEGDIETSSDEIKSVRQGPADAVIMNETSYNNLCEMLAKHQHQRWYNARANAGWSFGLRVDQENKQHPMMRPWEQLASEYQNIDYDMPHLFMDFLAEQGYVVVSREDLMKWLNK